MDGGAAAGAAARLAQCKVARGGGGTLWRRQHAGTECRVPHRVLRHLGAQRVVGGRQAARNAARQGGAAPKCGLARRAHIDNSIGRSAAAIRAQVHAVAQAASTVCNQVVGRSGGQAGGSVGVSGAVSRCSQLTTAVLQWRTQQMPLPRVARRAHVSVASVPAVAAIW